MEDSLFTKMIKGEIPCFKIYEDEHTLAILDIFPINKGHALVIPKKQSINMLEDSPQDLAHCMKTIQKVAKAVVKATNADGFNLGSNINKAAGQAIFHTHFHIIPRFEDDGLKHWPSGKYEEGQDKEMTDKIIDALD